MIEKYGIDETTPVLDKIKNFGFKYVTFSGSTLGTLMQLFLKRKNTIIDSGRKKALEIQSQYEEGLVQKQNDIEKLLNYGKA